MIEPSTAYVLVAIACLAAATFVTRAGMLLVSEQHLRLSPRVEAALRFAPACALSALVVPEVLAPGGAVDLSLANPRWLAALAAAALLLWRPNMPAGIALGMAVYAGVRLFVS
jgi:branched-subunit amino acid transport protein